ncbi:MAG: DNA-directed RNA polymerase subunit alpha [Candidatus Campbellbacteria bacterium]|nr:DNA-directed RNA polymerase subunit alpha [Candidatus Campbellbacteria bacterium]
MSEHNIVLPSKPKVIKEEEFSGVYEVDGLYPGYGHTLGNSLRRIILSSLEGAAIVSVKIDGVGHEFSTIEGVKEDVITILLNLKNVRVKLNTSETTTINLSVKGQKEVTAQDLEAPSQAEILNPDQYICSVTDKNAEISMEIKARKGLGYLPKEVLGEDRTEIGTIILDASFTPIRRVNYEVENMRVGNRTDFNRLRIFIETDGTLTPREALEQSIQIMISQLRAIVGFKEEAPVTEAKEESEESVSDANEEESTEEDSDTEYLKTRIETLDLSTRTINALTEANIRTVGGLARKKEEDILNLPGLGSKGLQEIKRAVTNFGITLK